MTRRNPRQGIDDKDLVVDEEEFQEQIRDSSQLQRC